MAAKKAAKKKVITKRRRSSSDAAPPAPTCETCGRPRLPMGIQVDQHEPCLRCQHEEKYPGRDYAVDAAAAEQRGIRLSSYLREQLEGEKVRG